MRNLTLASAAVADLPNAHVTATAFDLDENVIYATSERQNSDGEVDVEIWKLQDGESTPSAPFTMFTTVASSMPSVAQVISIRVLLESRKLAVIMSNGDISMVSMDDLDPVAEVEGTVESGILAAQWSPDDTSLVLITGEGKLILMTSTFDVLSEAPLNTSDFGEDAPINVGWGSKQTQFHGSLGKAAAQAPSVTAVGSSPDDDAVPRISWRGDGAYFVVSALSPDTPSDSQPNPNLRRRVLRVYNREAALQSTSEPVPGLEHVLSWRPSGNLIVGTQRFGYEGGGVGREGRHDVVFFERNGLRHGEFEIRAAELALRATKVDERRKWGYRVRETGWSSDSAVLALWIERDEGDVVQLWTMGNYHWYLKQEIAAPRALEKPGRFTSVTWHPETPLHLILTTPLAIIQRRYAWETCTSNSAPPQDSGAVAVIDGSSVLLTPFRVQNVPPPMSSLQLSLSTDIPSPIKTPVHACFSPKSDTFGLLWESGYVELWSLRTRLQGGPGKVMEPSRMWAGSVGRDHCRQIHITTIEDSSVVVVLHGGQESDVITIFNSNLGDGLVVGLKNVVTPFKNGRIVSLDENLVCESPDGEILRYDAGQRSFVPVGRFPGFCLQTRGTSVALLEDASAMTTVYVGLSSARKLHVADEHSNHYLLASNATSFTAASGFIIFTTTSHEAKFAPLTALTRVLDESSETSKMEWQSRRVERGSRIVVAVPSSMSLVLQMPRGNLETINPRPLVMEVIKQDLDAGNYRKAFLACRKHRIDLNAIVDHDKATFLERISSFVEQVHEVDFINLFLTGLGRGSQSPEIVAKICDSIRVELEKKDLTKYVNSILTAYVVKDPPDYEAGLAMLHRLQETDSALVEDAVKYIIFLVDADRLFDVALGMYDFTLVLLIAQHAQKDPREYLPFLRELRALDKYYQRFRIDDHLKRRQSALENLNLAGPQHFDECIRYIETHNLHEAALQIWKGTDRYNRILELYGDWLFERREFRQAAIVLMEAECLSKAMVAYERALLWQELFDLALEVKVEEEEIVATAYRVAEELTSKKRFSEAGSVLLDHAQDVRECVIALVQGNLFSEARRIITLHSRPELMDDIIHPGAFESCSQILEDLTECTEQLRKQRNRLRELRIRKIEEPDAFYGTEDPTLHNVDVMTDVSMAPTAFTRYTVAPTTVSRSSKRSSRSKRKMERKVGSGRKGTVDEEEYLLKSVSKLVTRFGTIEDEARTLLPHLFRLTPKHRQEGAVVQQRVTQFETELKGAIEEIWTRPPEEVVTDSWASRIEAVEKDKRVNPLDKVEKPVIPSGEWQIKLYNYE